MRRFLAVVSLALVFPVASSAQAAGAPVFSSKGFFLGASLSGTALTADDLDEDTESGGGLGLGLGYGFTPRLALFADAAAASISTEGESWVLSHFDLGLRYYFTGPARQFVPFVEGALTGRAGTQDDVTFVDDDGEVYEGDLEITGAGFTIGAGFNYFFNPSVALTTSIKLTKGEFSSVKFGNVTIDGLDIDATSARFGLGLSWYPGGGR